MKKKVFIILIVILACLYFLADLTLIKLNNKPLIILGTITDKEYTKYKGLLFNTYHCNINYKNYIVMKNKTFYCPSDSKVEFEIIDKSENCSQQLEMIYSDSKYNYYLECIKSGDIYIGIKGESELYSLRYILDNEVFTIDELMRNGLKVIVENKDEK